LVLLKRQAKRRKSMPKLIKVVPEKKYKPRLGDRPIRRKVKKKPELKLWRFRLDGTVWDGTGRGLNDIVNLINKIVTGVTPAFVKHEHRITGKTVEVVDIAAEIEAANELKKQREKAKKRAKKMEEYMINPPILKKRREKK
jgi:hypothetical protein